MTKMGRILEEERIAYGKEVAERVTKQVTEEVTIRVTEEVTEKVTKEVTDKVTRDVTDEVTEKVRGESIGVLVDFCKKMKGNISDVIDSIVTEYGMSPADARRKVEMYW